MARLAGKGTHYRLAVLNPAGEPSAATFDVPSVSTILDTVINKPALQYWTYKQTLAGLEGLFRKYGTAVPKDVDSLASLLKREGLRPTDSRDSAAKFGTNQHDLLEALATGGKRAANKVAKDALAGSPTNPVAAWWATKPCQDVLSVEKPVVSFQGPYAGTLDLCYRDKNGDVVLLDLKTGGVYHQSFLQIAAYKLAWEEQGGPPVDKLVILQCPRVGGSYTEHTVSSPEAIDGLQDSWRAALDLYRKLPKSYKAGEVVTVDLTV